MISSSYNHGFLTLKESLRQFFFSISLVIWLDIGQGYFKRQTNFEKSVFLLVMHCLYMVLKF